MSSETIIVDGGFVMVNGVNDRSWWIVAGPAAKDELREATNGEVAVPGTDGMWHLIAPSPKGEVIDWKWSKKGNPELSK